MVEPISAPLHAALADTLRLLDADLDMLLPLPDGPEARVVEAMRYASIGAGKRIRPFLVLEGAKLFGVAPLSARRVAAAVEMLHCYSLVHDDLPAMDDDDLRRGRPTVHRAFDEATAILAGDGLLTRCFEVLADPETHSDPSVRAELVRGCAAAAGPNGMVGGQMVDLRAATLALDTQGIIRLQRMKTGAIIAFAAEAGAILGKAAPQLRQALHHYAHDLGLAFQIADDLLDVEGSAAETGKATGKDAGQGKATIVGLLGVDRAKAQMQMLADQACAHLDPFAERAHLLRALASFVVTRRR